MTSDSAMSGFPEWEGGRKKLEDICLICRSFAKNYRQAEDTKCLLSFKVPV